MFRGNVNKRKFISVSESGPTVGGSSRFLLPAASRRHLLSSRSCGAHQTPRALSELLQQEGGQAGGPCLQSRRPGHVRQPCFLIQNSVQGHISLCRKLGLAGSQWPSEAGWGKKRGPATTVCCMWDLWSANSPGPTEGVCLCTKRSRPLTLPPEAHSRKKRDLSVKSGLWQVLWPPLKQVS